MDRETTLLTSAGSAICGAAAVLVYPLLYPLLGMEEGLYGIYIGATVHEVAQVVAAGEFAGPVPLHPGADAVRAAAHRGRAGEPAADGVGDAG
ncbi:putative sulfate exporter family transporter [Halomonas sp. M4R1S46]|uniref:putative sulfate exporter family transporter n=1 Tax=Halomonas sp. M4R1S46 TaxID=2982692 RepID=UPI0021E4052F|nr:putative sulfate exporter family transporter [Halomonas sp. M4R1S46]UYG07081.1 putative sulfate exporter family transporter [Halomonas sp. M4R1S46]